MIRALFVAATMLVAASALSAQDPLTKMKGLANKAKAAEDAHIAKEQQVDAKASAPQQQKTKVADKPGEKPAKPADKTVKPGVQRPGAKLDVATTDTAGPPSSLMRELFVYEPAGRRDPFFSLLSTSELRPALSDLRLTGIAFARTGRSVATLRDQTDNKLYSVSAGTALGRMHVAAITARSVVFTIEEFGTTRQDSLVLRDSTKARAK